MLIDEVESFAVRRSLASFETNPVDVQRATDAVLAGLRAAPAWALHSGPCHQPQSSYLWLIRLDTLRRAAEGLPGRDAG